jgi:uncharacterized protein YdhG (YjbR/CyaY superfamily)
MKTGHISPKNIDEYISGFPPEIQVILNKIRVRISEVAPEAEETISYHIPTFKYFGNLVHFAAFKSYIGFYPTPSGIEKFKKELSVYELSKGTIRFPLNKPVPYDLIRKITAFRVKENMKKVQNKKK